MPQDDNSLTLESEPTKLVKSTIPVLSDDTVANIPSELADELDETTNVSFLSRVGQIIGKIGPRSTKPFLTTTRDSIIIAIITVLVFLIMMVAYYFATGNLAEIKTSAFWMTMGRSFAFTLFLGYAYEYAGFNAMLAESAMRYAKGSALSKYKTRNEAIIAEIANTEWRRAVNEQVDKFADPGCQKAIDDATADLDMNIKRMNALIHSARELPLIQKLLEDGIIDKDLILVKINKRKTYITADDLDLILNLDPTDPDGNLDRLRAGPRLLEILGLNTPLIHYFVRNGFNKLKGVKTRHGYSIDMPKMMEATGLKSLKEPSKKSLRTKVAKMAVIM
jgi:hypothetical protein